MTRPSDSHLLLTRMAIYLGVFLITLSGLIFEIGLTRIYSATIWYHFAFVAISVALLGWGLGGLALHLLKRRITPSLEKAAVLSALYGLTHPDRARDHREVPVPAGAAAAVLHRRRSSRSSSPAWRCR